MSSEPVGDASDFAAMLGSKLESSRKLAETLTRAPVAEGDDQQQGAVDDAVDGAEPNVQAPAQSPDIEAERREAAQLLLGDPKMSALVTGDTVAEIVKSAAYVAQSLRELQAENEAKPAPPNFDGGVRGVPESAPQSHEEFLTGIFDNLRAGDGRGW